ncbi:hypothetical protein BKI52_44650 [marine bacterium AO1-C]|nr:hypothetical protein BKI52_44650 [marine bacterium AO1-C]
MKLFGLLLMIFIFFGCDSDQTTNPREIEVYQVLQEATIKQLKDFEYFTKVILKDTHPDSLISRNNQRIKKWVIQLMADIQLLEKELVTKAGDGTQPNTKFPKRPNEIKITAKTLKAKIPPIEKSLIQYVALLKEIGKDVPLPDLKTWEGSLYPRYFEGTTLMQSLVMLQQIRNDVWYNANLVSQRTSY